MAQNELYKIAIDQCQREVIKNNILGTYSTIINKNLNIGLNSQIYCFTYF